jgi:hypothetical protein
VSRSIQTISDGKTATKNVVVITRGKRRIREEVLCSSITGLAQSSQRVFLGV